MWLSRLETNWIKSVCRFSKTFLLWIFWIPEHFNIARDWHCMRVHLFVWHVKGLKYYRIISRNITNILLIFANFLYAKNTLYCTILATWYLHWSGKKVHQSICTTPHLWRTKSERIFYFLRILFHAFCGFSMNGETFNIALF